MADLFSGSPERNEKSKRIDGLRKLFSAGYSAPAGGEERYLAYLEGLEDLSSNDFARAISETLRRHRSSFLPSPGEVRGYLDVARQTGSPAPSRAKSDCADCCGTGWSVAEYEVLGQPARGVRPCHCLKKGAA